MRKEGTPTQYHGCWGRGVLWWLGKVVREDWTDLQLGSADKGEPTYSKKSPSLLKDCGKVKLEGVVIIVDQKTLIVASVKGSRQMLALLLILPAEETSVTRAVESDKYREMRYRKIAGEMTVLKLN